MKKLLLIVSAFVLVIASCKKKEFPKNVEEQPTFYISALVDGQPVSVKAGMYGYYMYSGYTQDSNGMYTFIADVKPEGCSNTCANSLKLEFNDNKMSPIGGTSNINSSIKVGTYQFANTATIVPTLIGYEVNFKSMFNKMPPNSYLWNFGDGSPLNNLDANPTHTYTQAGIFNVRVGISEGSLPMTFIENPVKVTISGAAVKTRIGIDAVNGNSISFRNITNGGSGPYTYKWNFNDGGFPSTDPNPTHVFQNPGMYMVNLKVKDLYNDSAEYNFNVNTASSFLAAPNFSVNSVTPLYATTATNLLSKVKITYTDMNGITYSSNMQPQNTSGSSFSIVSVEEYSSNEHNQTTKKLKVNFACKLYNGSSAVNLTNGEAVIAVSYK